MLYLQVKLDDTIQIIVDGKVLNVKVHQTTKGSCKLSFDSIEFKVQYRNQEVKRERNKKLLQFKE